MENKTEFQGELWATDPVTKEPMMISYSQDLQLKTQKELEKTRVEIEKSNKLRMLILLAIGIVIVLIALVYFRTGIIGHALRNIAC